MDFHKLTDDAIRRIRAEAYKIQAGDHAESFPILSQFGDEDLSETTDVRVQDGVATVRISGPIDPYFGVDLKAINSEIEDAGDLQQINLLLSSPGGMFAPALEFYNDLRSYADKGVEIVAEARSIVASAAVLPFLAGDERLMNTGAQLMIHEPRTALIMSGTAEDIEKRSTQVVNSLAAAADSIREVYADRVTASAEKLDEMINSETWLNADSAIEHGFATEEGESGSQITNAADDQAVLLFQGTLSGLIENQRSF